jgi:hypothetical protein
MYSMAAFGPVLGFLLGAYLLSFHMDTFSGNFVGNIGKVFKKFKKPEIISLIYFYRSD